jgi:hypothetical protein
MGRLWRHGTQSPNTSISLVNRDCCSYRATIAPPSDGRAVAGAIVAIGTTLGRKRLATPVDRFELHANTVHLADNDHSGAYGRPVNSKQRARKLKRRQAHRERSNLPRRVMNHASYPTVKQGHLVPATYQRFFATDGSVMVHVPGRSDCVRLKVEDAGTRSKAYRRVRPDGTEIDDVEASLSSLERHYRPVLEQITNGDPISDRMKATLAQFFGVQMVRGPMFFRLARSISEQTVRQKVTIENVSPEALARARGDIDVLHDQAIGALWNARFLDMVTRSQKLSWVLGCMRWQVLNFPAPIVAYCDQPVVVWPLGVERIDARPTEPALGPINALEIRVPLAPNLLLLMTWEDADDQTTHTPAPSSFAADTNALVVAQADKQWMHQPGTEPPVAKGVLTPTSSVLNPFYGPAHAAQSIRRATAAKELDRVLGRTWLNTVKVITSMQFSNKPTPGSSVIRRVRVARS